MWVHSFGHVVLIVIINAGTSILLLGVTYQQVQAGLLKEPASS